MELARGAMGMPLLQGAIAALCTFVLEDPTTVGSGLLVAAGKMSFATAFVGLTIGIAGGDFGLYLLGRFAKERVERWGIIDHERLERASAWFGRNLASAVLSSRFLPGMRLPTYVAAGILKVPAGRFLAVAVAASVAWTLILLSLTVHLGGAALERAGRMKLPVGLTLVALIAFGQWLGARRRRKIGREATEPITSVFEFWPPWLFYLPVVPWWLWLSLRHRGILLPTAANPSIYAGGFIGESKGAILALVPQEQRHWVAPWVAWRKEAGVSIDAACAEAAAVLERSGLAFPLVAKPNVGQRGAGVRPLHDGRELRDYLEAFPAGARMILQALVPFPHEAGILWYRLPGEERGRIFSVTRKEFPAVTGDGQRTLRELILADPRARRLRRVYLRRHRERQEAIPATGERVPLVFAGNHCQGAIFRNGRELATPALAARIDEIARSIPEFHFGRIDLRFRSEEELTRGEGFAIVEINGAGAEATHIWDARTRLTEGYSVLFEQFGILFEIGARNRRRGFRPVTVRQFLRDLLAYRRLAQGYPETW
ncbi:DedA family protein [Geobacter sp.]|uniref:DedA family protein n=1 Tax=Geobacter sp. TaxID=46610 RepID=UPI0027B9E7F7|nr:DedA family protein [Geobacter sp.]